MLLVGDLECKVRDCIVVEEAYNPCALLFNQISMMGFDGWNMLMPAVFGLHALFVFAIFLGIVFMFIWAYKSFDKNQLRKCTRWFLIVGIIGALLTTGCVFFGFRGLNKGGDERFCKFFKGGYSKCAAFEEEDDDEDVTVVPADTAAPVVK